MRTFWLGLAAASMLAITAPAQAQSWDGDHHGHNGDGQDHHHSHHNGSVFGPTVFADANNQHGHFNNNGGFADDWDGGQWALYNNQSWRPDSYNDWWHDRPDRAFPRWMARNQDCSRQWYSGDTLRC